VLASRPEATAQILVAVLEALHALHRRGVILNEGARAKMQYLTPKPAFLIGWRTEWASVWANESGNVADREGEGQPDPYPRLLSATGSETAHYPARDLLWFLNGTPRDLPLGLAADLLVVVAMDDRPSPSPALFILAPLGLVRAMDLPEGWEAYATPVGGTDVSVLEEEPPLLRSAWAVQQCTAAGSAVLKNSSEWARQDLRTALGSLGAASPLVVVRAMGGTKFAIVAGAELQQTIGPTPCSRSAP